MLTLRSVLIACLFKSYLVPSSSEEEKSCFSRLHGSVGDVKVNTEAIRELNNFQLLPRLKSLLSRDFFRFYEINLARPCPFFKEDLRCASKDCRVKDCSIEELPQGLRDRKHSNNKHYEHMYSKEANKKGVGSEEGIECELSKLDSSLSDERKSILEDWSEYDATDEGSFCEPDDDNSDRLIHVDLLKNPERYTGYKGVASNNVWYLIYKENCFTDELTPRELTYYPIESTRCLEKRAFYRIISGLHTSITTHLTYRFPRNLIHGPEGGITSAFLGTIEWVPNVDEFRKRFDPENIPDGPIRLRNLYFIYLVELRALAKAAPYLRKLEYYTGNAAEDAETKSCVEDLLDRIEGLGNQFDERMFFKQADEETILLKKRFRSNFRNISRIMDCVGCDKCKMWGKLQTEGLGTALKILFTNRKHDYDAEKPAKLEPGFHLSRKEIVSLFNAFGRLSTSIRALDEFCDLMDEQKQPKPRR